MEFGKFFSGWQIILLRHTGDFQKSVLLGHKNLETLLRAPHVAPELLPEGKGLP